MSGRTPVPQQKHGPAVAAGLDRFNAAPAGAAEAALLACCGSRRWAQRLVAHRPYPDLESLLAAADEAAYDLSCDEISGALADESSAGLRDGAPASARTALRAAHAAYESSFGHAFVICLDGLRPEEQLNQVLGGIRTRLGNEPDEERAVAADELRRLARGRLAHLVSEPQKSVDFLENADHPGHTGRPDRPDSPSVAV
ncbi:2-oxo-4-hydroxy-4-carboxy-5-ureidoimidazoline decarboxylase [Streptomyces sp. ISL-98]|uniref:2-oxo-4-hydroxy-4-carboxy-5-ureidoimidazoline decarboxylase n=1 Tax=Streptomyces sp. ISL-98 TaxID=2819192 RepID=UPI001BEB6A16|nr:2-oxo-4-hydroxy-4-carboxy-5-ureidoimidazoline decarboxylase [Streptomyces sp. ISL-98]MBT2507239.1 2-oxo-4-hydroxy-4-carboxy-5-ureidoimidazoline decarboxylase [Streptomyces sp. ISL-98]